MGKKRFWYSRTLLSVPHVSVCYSVLFRGNVHGEWGFRYSNKLSKTRVLVGGWNGKHLKISEK